MSIISAHDLIQELTKRGLQDINRSRKPKHNPTIGKQYENLTKSVLKKSIFKDFDLRVVSGFIKGKHGKESRQIDCMIVVGDGEAISHTDELYYDIENVLCVVEIKKRLYKNDLASGFTNLNSVTDIHFDDINIESLIKKSTKKEARLVNKAYESITGTTVPEYFSMENEANSRLYASLVREVHLPIRILYGYQGYTKEDGLRKEFFKLLENNILTKGFGAAGLPNLIISKSNTIVKTNGMPYALTTSVPNPPKELENAYCWMGSYNKNPLLLLLELLWTRLDVKFDLPENIFGDIKTKELIAPLLLVEGHKEGWAVCEINFPRTDIEQNTITTNEKIPLTEEEYDILNCLQFKEGRASMNFVQQYMNAVPNDTFKNALNNLSNLHLIQVKNDIVSTLDEIILIYGKDILAIRNPMGEY